MARWGTAGIPITLSIEFYANGYLFDPANVNTVYIYDAITNGNVVGYAIPVRYAVGKYEINWTIPATTTQTTLYDEWSWSVEENGPVRKKINGFNIVDGDVSTNNNSIIRIDIEDPNVVKTPRPVWESLIGLRNVQDVGNGSGLLLSWGRALPFDQDKVVHYNIYWSSTRFGVFDNPPYAVTTLQQAVLNVNPGAINYFAVRATEFDTDEFDIQQLPQIGVGLHQYPEAVTLQNSTDGYEAEFEVDNTIDYPDAGFLLVGQEIVYYTNQTDTSFSVTENQRGAYSTSAVEHYEGEEVRLFHGVEEHNTIIFQETAAWHKSEGQQHDIDAIGSANADEDGYRAVNEDIITTNLGANEEEFADFTAYDFCSYHRPSLQALFTGNCIHSYVGGEFAGSRGLFLTDRNLARLEVMLGVTGEPMILLRRKWTGRRCRCTGLRREHPKSRCSYCYGTSFDGGFDRYINTRAISETSDNTQGYIMVRVNPYADDLDLVVDQGLRQPVELTAWTISIPTIKDRDVLVRFNSDGTEEFRYEALSVTRNKLFLNESGKQEFTMRRLDKTDEIYTYDKSI